MKLCQLHTLAEMAGQKCNKPDAQREVKKNQWKRWQTNEVDRILIFLDPAQEIPEGAYDPQLQ